MADQPGWLLRLVAAVEQYEEVHPKVEEGAGCFGAALANVPADVRSMARGYAQGRRDAEAVPLLVSQTAIGDGLSANAVFEKLAAVPKAERADARWVMSRVTAEALCAAMGTPKPIPFAAMTLVGLPVDFDDTAIGMELRTAREHGTRSPENVVPRA